MLTSYKELVVWQKSKELNFTNNEDFSEVNNLLTEVMKMLNKTKCHSDPDVNRERNLPPQSTILTWKIATLIARNDNLFLVVVNYTSLFHSYVVASDS